MTITFRLEQSTSIGRDRLGPQLENQYPPQVEAEEARTCRLTTKCGALFTGLGKEPPRLPGDCRVCHRVRLAPYIYILHMEAGEAKGFQGMSTKGSGATNATRFKVVSQP